MRGCRGTNIKYVKFCKKCLCKLNRFNRGTHCYSCAPLFAAERALRADVRAKSLAVNRKVKVR